MIISSTTAVDTPLAPAVIPNIETSGNGAAPPLAGAIMAPVPDMRARAVELAKQGFAVFKLPPGKKFPPPAAFFDVATCDPDRVHKMWSDPVTGESLHNNIGIATGAQLCVLDIDVKHARAGEESLDLVVDVHGLDTDTRTASTPSRGKHLFYSIPPDVEIGQDLGRKLGAGIDVKCFHGYVVGVGSVTSEGEYTWLNDKPILPLSRQLIDLLKRTPRTKAAPLGKSLVELDTDTAIAWAANWLRDSAPRGHP